MKIREKLMHKYALSEQGAADMLKAFAAVTVSDLVLMMPVSLLYFLVKDYMEGNLGARAGFYIGGVAAALVLIAITMPLFCLLMWKAACEGSPWRRSCGRSPFPISEKRICLI